MILRKNIDSTRQQMACRPRRRAEQGRKNRQESTNYRFLGVSHSLSLVLVWFGDYIIHHEGTMRFYCVSKAVSVVKKKYSNKERTCNMIVISGAMAACAIFIVVVLILALFGDKDAQDYVKENGGGCLGCLGSIIAIIIVFLMILGALIIR